MSQDSTAAPKKEAKKHINTMPVCFIFCLSKVAVDKTADERKERENQEADGSGDQVEKVTREETVLVALQENKLAKLIEKIGDGEYNKAGESVKALWLFLGERLYPRMSPVIRRAWNNMSIEVNEKLIHDNIDISDEALTLLVLSEKRSELLERTKIGKRKDKANKRKRTNDGETPEVSRGPKRSNLVNKLSDYVKHYERIKKLRKDDKEMGLGWYSATCKEIMERKKEANQGVADGGSSEGSSQSSERNNENAGFVLGAMPMTSIPIGLEGGAQSITFEEIVTTATAV